MEAANRQSVSAARHWQPRDDGNVGSALAACLRRVLSETTWDCCRVAEGLRAVAGLLSLPIPNNNASAQSPFRQLNYLDVLGGLSSRARNTAHVGRRKPNVVVSIDGEQCRGTKK
ncbi:hypothetical protein N9L68_06705 [bacterium]|nr:hypothetical protein [bacterium]